MSIWQVSAASRKYDTPFIMVRGSSEISMQLSNLSLSSHPITDTKLSLSSL